MAKRPVKKRKPRKVVKPSRKPRFNSRISRAERAAKASQPEPFEPVFNLTIGTPDDPFHIDPLSIPGGVALHWITLSVDDLDRAQSFGWKPVEGVGGVKGNMLVWAPVAIAEAQRDANIKRARDQIHEARELFGLNGRREGHPFPIAPQSFMVSSAYETVPSDTAPLDVDVTVRLRLPGRLQDVAAALKLSPEVYAQRRMELYVRGELAGLLLPVIYHDGYPAKSLELHESGNFSLVPRI